ncbi:hypothetical protein PR048_011606 [Dryococelus australis]|uniref:Uncharacterized protein n=1 Tax=Dryococelus australis TaxID=614101 RepID=A0ABQ9HM23_9NEOP|nr:hypothetical protein PR048_011606 [Dryococelus australis]
MHSLAVFRVLRGFAASFVDIAFSLLRSFISEGNAIRCALESRVYIVSQTHRELVAECHTKPRHTYEALRIFFFTPMRVQRGRHEAAPATHSLRGWGGAGDPRGNPTTSAIVRHDFHVRKSVSGPAGTRTRLYSVWEAIALATAQPRPRKYKVITPTGTSSVHTKIRNLCVFPKTSRFGNEQCRGYTRRLSRCKERNVVPVGRDRDNSACRFRIKPRETHRQNNLLLPVNACHFTITVRHCYRHSGEHKIKRTCHIPLNKEKHPITYENSVEQRQNAREGKREIYEKTRRPATSSGTITTCENPGATRPGIDPGSRRREASMSNRSATAAPGWLKAADRKVLPFSPVGRGDAPDTIQHMGRYDNASFCHLCNPGSTLGLSRGWHAVTLPHLIRFIHFCVTGALSYHPFEGHIPPSCVPRFKGHLSEMIFRAVEMEKTNTVGNNCAQTNRRVANSRPVTGSTENAPCLHGRARAKYEAHSCNFIVYRVVRVNELCSRAPCTAWNKRFSVEKRDETGMLGGRGGSTSTTLSCATL